MCDGRFQVNWQGDASCGSCTAGWTGADCSVSFLSTTTKAICSASSMGRSVPELPVCLYTCLSGLVFSCLPLSCLSCSPPPRPSAWRPTWAGQYQYYLSVYIPLCLVLSTYLPTHPSAHLASYLPTCLPTYLSVCLSVYPPIYVSFYVCMYMSVYVYIYLIYVSL